MDLQWTKARAQQPRRLVQRIGKVEADGNKKFKGDDYLVNNKAGGEQASNKSACGIGGPATRQNGKK